MIELSIKNFIQTHSDWEELLSRPPYNLTIRKDEGLVLFKYNQFESDMNERICQEARGIIFDEETLEPVCVPFFKFFNYGEVMAADIDWNTACVKEKVDGSLIKVFFNKRTDAWQIATNGTINAFKAEVDDKGTTFGALFLDAFGVGYFEMIKHLSKNYTYMFELVHPTSQVVIAYGEKAVYYIGKRSNVTYEEWEPNDEEIVSLCRVPKRYGMRNLSETLQLIQELNDGGHEGVVVVDANFNRIKMKTEEYLVKARIANRGPLTTKRFATMYLNGTLDDYLAFAPEKKEEVDEYLLQIANWARDMEDCAKAVNRTCIGFTRKNIVGFIQGHSKMRKVPAFFNFYMRYLDMKVSHPLEYISNMSVAQLVKGLTS